MTLKPSRVPKSIGLSALRGSAVVLVGSEPLIDVGGGARHMIASVSKQFVAASMLVAQGDGLLDVGDSVCYHVPELGAAYDDVSLHHLLSHTSGVRHWTRDVPGLWISEAGTAVDRIGVLAQTPLLAPPGREWHYSSVGYSLLVAVIERATGSSYADFVRERLTEPADLTDTTVGPPRAGARLATGHRNGAAVPAAELASTAGTGYVWSTARDLARWTHSLHRGLLPVELHALLVYPHVDLPPSDPQALAPAYGYGLFIGTIAGRRAWFHPGDNPGFCAFTAFLPDLDISLGLVSAEETTDVADLAERLVVFAAASTVAS